MTLSKNYASPLYKILSPPDPSFDLSRDLNYMPSFPQAEELSPRGRKG